VLDPPADAVSLVKDEDAEEESGWQLHAYFAEAPDRDAIAEAFAAIGLSLDAPTEETLDDDHDWVADALEGLGVVQAGPFVVHGSHDSARAAGLPGHRILVEANRAFGTGHHPTTAGCLEALGTLAETRPACVLDLGTGSGLLAIAARRLWPGAGILATDIDVPSVRIAEENAALNDAPGLRFTVADGVDEAVRAAGPFDVVMANILAEPLIALAPAIREVVAEGGRVLLAGLLARQADGVIAAYEAEGLRVLRRSGDAWPVLLLGKHGLLQSIAAA
jgi:ribosomal protein L11 methyltransferase